MFRNLSSSEFENEIKNNNNAVVIDVRTLAEFKSGYILNAINIDISSADFADKINELDKNKDYYVYCRSGGRSATACQYMVSIGFKKVNNLEGGILSYDGEIVY